jgi:hypothetical protein
MRCVVIIYTHLEPFYNMSRAKYWVFTLNNYTEEDKILLSTLCLESPEVAYLGYGEEVAPSSGTPHLQGLVELNRALRLRQVTQILGGRVHVEVRRGTFEQAKEYCEKEGQFVEYGIRVSRGRGARTDLDALREDLRNGRTLVDISNDHFSSFLRYRRSIFSYVGLNAKKRNWQMSVIVYWGPTGSGKTSAVYNNAATSEDVWTYPGNGWFDGYNGQKIALFDDFSGSEFKLPYLLKVLDRYPMQVPIKGDFVNWAPEEVYITSNLNPNCWYPNAHNEHVSALFRRFTNVVKIE